MASFKMVALAAFAVILVLALIVEVAGDDAVPEVSVTGPNLSSCVQGDRIIT